MARRRGSCLAWPGDRARLPRATPVAEPAAPATASSERSQAKAARPWFRTCIEQVCVRQDSFIRPVRRYHRGIVARNPFVVARQPLLVPISTVRAMSDQQSFPSRLFGRESRDILYVERTVGQSVGDKGRMVRRAPERRPRSSLDLCVRGRRPWHRRGRAGRPVTARCGRQNRVISRRTLSMNLVTDGDCRFCNP